MDGSGLIFIVMPIVIPVALFVLVATPVLADAYLTRKSRAAQQGAQPRPAGQRHRVTIWWKLRHLAVAFLLLLRLG
jgi:hypothetical protein